MQTVFIVMKNADFTEGRGPMMVHKIFSKFIEAENYVLSQDGIYGSKQGRSPYRMSNLNEASYNGYDIKTEVVESTSADVIAKEQAERKQQAEKRLAETKARALAKLSFEERQSLGL